MANHDFGFEHGEILGRIGATWYASYAYHRHCDPSHNNFTFVGTWKSRASNYKGHLELEKYLMEKISEMTPQRLATNTIGLSGEEVLRMAREVLVRL